MEIEISGIYKITNLIDGKTYIGQSINIQKRFVTHKSNLKNKRHYNKNLQESWENFGSENFIFETLEECNHEQLNEKETYWILFYQSNDNNYGYNRNDGGDSGCPNEETREKNRIASTGKKHTEEVKRKIGEGNKGKIVSDETREKLRQHNLGKTHSEETRKKLGNISRGKVHSEESKQKVSEKLKGRIRTTEHSENLSKALTGKFLGDKSYNAKISEIEALEIFKRVSGGQSRKQVSKNMNVSIPIIHSIMNGICWSHVTGLPKKIIIKKKKINK